MTDNTAESLDQVIELIEAGYEYMLAYAAQGREEEGQAGGDGMSIRQFLANLAKGLEKIDYALAEKVETLDLHPAALQALENFRIKLAGDAAAALLAVRVVQTAPAISSQLVDNLNASVHLRCLLTDIFVIDEALKIHRRKSGMPPQS